MSAELQAFSDFIRVFGFPTFVVLLFGFLILVPRRDKESRQVHSPRLVPGTAYDDLLDQLATVRSEAAAAKFTAREECAKDIAYFKERFESERERFVTVNANAIAQSKLIETLTVEIRESRKRNHPQ